jgi:nucleotide-binding universal stress UspA family protein
MLSDMTKVLIALDDNDDSIQAAALARRLFGDDAEYLAINVFEHSPSPVRPGSSWPTTPIGGSPMAWGAVSPYPMDQVEPAVNPDVPEITERDVAARDALAAAERAGLGAAEVIGEVGDPARAILDAAHEHAVDVVVVGSHQRSWLSRLFSRSVSAEVVKRADLPVLVAK